MPIANCELYTKFELVSLFEDMHLLADRVRLEGMERMKTKFDSRAWKVTAGKKNDTKICSRPYANLSISSQEVLESLLRAFLERAPLADVAEAAAHIDVNLAGKGYLEIRKVLCGRLRCDAQIAAKDGFEFLKLCEQYSRGSGI
jgi:hypothetical protein